MSTLRPFVQVRVAKLSDAQNRALPTWALWARGSTCCAHGHDRFVIECRERVVGATWLVVP